MVYGYTTSSGVFTVGKRPAGICFLFFFFFFILGAEDHYD